MPEPACQGKKKAELNDLGKCTILRICSVLFSREALKRYRYNVGAFRSLDDFPHYGIKIQDPSRGTPSFLVFSIPFHAKY